jgi:hypothetical protein
MVISETYRVSFMIAAFPFPELELLSDTKLLQVGIYPVNRPVDN